MEVKTRKCDECGCLLPKNSKGDSLGITNVTNYFGIDIHYQGLNDEKPRHKVMRHDQKHDPMDFCNLECLTSWMAFKVTNHFIEHCEGETNEKANLSQIRYDSTGHAPDTPGVVISSRKEDSIPCDPQLKGNY